MATALQCPACGFKHRLDAVAETPVFSCSRCERQLKLPAQLRNSAAARPGEAALPRIKDSSPTPSRSASAGAVSSPRRSKRRSSGAAGAARIPVKILVWVVAFVLGAGAVRILASWTGFVDTNTFLDLMLDHSFSTYWRLLVLIPVWAFFATLFATAFIEGPEWWARRSRPSTKPTIKRLLPAAVPTSEPKPAPAAAGRTRDPGARMARRVPARRDVEPASVPVRPASKTPDSKRVAASATEDAPPTGAQRPRRIPRRDTAS